MEETCHQYVAGASQCFVGALDCLIDGLCTPSYLVPDGRTMCDARGSRCIRNEFSRPNVKVGPVEPPTLDGHILFPDAQCVGDLGSGTVSFSHLFSDAVVKPCSDVGNQGKEGPLRDSFRVRYCRSNGAARRRLIDMKVSINVAYSLVNAGLSKADV